MLPITPGTHESVSAEVVGLEPTTAAPRPVFKTGSSSGRMTSDCKLRELESNQRLLVQSQASLPTATTPQCSANQRESRFAIRSTPSGNRTRSASFKGSRHDYVPERVPGGNRTRLSSLGSWCLSRSATGTRRRKVRESNPQGCEARPGSSGVPSPVGLPFHKAAAAGIEPASARLTAARPYQHGDHRINSVRTAGVEPAFSCSQGTRDTRLPHVLKLRAPSGSRTHASATARQQATATSWALGWKPNCQRSKSTGRDSNPRRRITKAVSSPLDHRCVFLCGRPMPFPI